MEGALIMLEATRGSTDTSLELMYADAVFPADIQPPGAPTTPLSSAKTVLLTGATGFVGAYLLHTLLRETSAVILCLVRPGLRGSGAERIRRNLEAYALWEPEFAERIRPLAGNLACPALGWSEAEQTLLAENVDVIVHGAAEVNWVRPYTRLRAANVLGTLELLRLACRTRTKPFHFLSTISVCYATTAHARTLTEADDPWPLCDRLHLGYAQTKSVAEQLVRQAGQRGLPTVIYRPALITGDSRTGAANPGDFLARGLGTCIRLGYAPDIDWSIDACPVDHVARVVVRQAMTSPSQRPLVLHLVHPQPRHWQEMVLWMHLYGYPLRLVSYRTWLRRLECSARTRRHPLLPLLDFFQTRLGSMTLAETYHARRRTSVCARQTQQSLAALGLPCPGLDARWLERFFGSLTSQGVVPSCGHAHTNGDCKAVPSPPWEASLPALLRHTFADPCLQVEAKASADRLSQQSILTELTSWRRGSSAGLFRLPLRLISQRADIPNALEVVVKVKLEDQYLLEVAEAAAALCYPRVGDAFTRWRTRLGFVGGHLREIALYHQADVRWQRYTPRLYGAEWQADYQRSVIVLEDLSRAWMDAQPGSDWRPEQIEAAVRGLADLHAIWLERPDELRARPWLGHVFTAAHMAEMNDLWSALAAYATRFFVPWLGPDIRRVQRKLLTRLERWWRPLEQLPHTLIHNDFNPRNLALRPSAAGPQLCAYDWELATSAVPQHDLAQLLCFVLPSNCARSTVQHYLELHRRSLEAASGRRLNAVDWQHGFGLVLADLLIHRWTMYALVHAIRPQSFLERVLQTWRTLFAYFDPLR
jgi:thioester reductase-like protein